MPLLTPTTEPHLSNLEPSAILASRALRTYLNYLVDNMGNSLATINSQRVWLAVSFLTVIDVCRGQTDAFTRQVTCPDNNAITGYTNIPNLNADMADELTRITTGGGTVPADGYTVRLCPSNTAEFDVTSGAIRPVLGTLAIVCGSGTMTTNNEVCIIDGGQNQVVLDDSQVDGYTITDVSLQGVTFRSFGSRAVQMQASEPTTLNLQNVVWENFSNARALVEIEDTGTVRIANGLVQSTMDPPDTNTDIAFFTNSGGGNLDVNGMQITNVRAQTGIFNNVNNGNTSLRGVAISGSTLDTNVARIEGGTMTIDMLTLSSNLRLDNVVFARNTGTTMTVSNVNFLNNQSSEIFNGFNIGGGAVATIDNLVFESNTNVLYAITSQAQGGMSASVTLTGSRFANNQGIGTQLGNAPSALVSSFGNNAGRPTLSVSRSDFDGNRNFVAAITGQFGGDFRVTQSCFSNSNADVVAYSDGSGTATSEVATNFIDPSYTITGPECTTEEAGRLLVEQSSSGGCFSGQTNCVATCLPFASSDVCLSQVELSEAPSLEPSLEPSVSSKPSRRDDSGAPSLVPSTAPTGRPTNVAIFDPTTTPSTVPSSQGDSNAPSTSQRPSHAPTSFPTTMAEFEPTGDPTTSEAMISANPTSIFDSILPSLSFPPTLSLAPVAPTKPPTYRKDCQDGDDDDDDDGKGKGGDDDDDDYIGKGKGRGTKKRKSNDCRMGKRKKRVKREKLFGTSMTNKGKGGKTKIEKLQKKLKKENSSKNSKSSKSSRRSKHDEYGYYYSSKSDKKKGGWD